MLRLWSLGFKNTDLRPAVETKSVQVSYTSGNVNQPVFPSMQAFQVVVILDRGKGSVAEKGYFALSAMSVTAEHQVPFVFGKEGLGVGVV